MILVNFKLYEETFKDGAVKLAKICQKVMEKTGVEIIPVVSALDVYRIKKEVGIKTYIQHVDEYENGAKTGYISPTQAKEVGADGALINHSEHQIKPGTIRKILNKIPKDFEVIVCLKSMGQAESWARNLKAVTIAYEPHYLIGNKEKSVASERSDVIKKMVEKYEKLKVPVIVGAGINSVDDIKTSLKLGAKGVLISSGVVKSKNPEEELIRLSGAF